MSKPKDFGWSAAGEYVVRADAGGVALPTPEAIRARRVRFDDSVREIPDDFFHVGDREPYCALEEVFIPASVMRIGVAVFAFCVSLRVVTCQPPVSLRPVSLEAMFAKCQSLADISFLAAWDTSEVTSMKGTFAACTALSDISPIAGWNTSHVRTMAALFAGCSALCDLTPLAAWDTSRVADATSLFAGCSAAPVPPNLLRLTSLETA